MTVFETLKRIAGTADDGSAEYECQQCGAGFEVQRQVCPDCGGFSIERGEW